MVLANPGVPLATAAVFAGLARRDNPPLAAPPALPDAAALVAFLAAQRNDLEAPAAALAPPIAEALRRPRRPARLPARPDVRLRRHLLRPLRRRPGGARRRRRAAPRPPRLVGRRRAGRVMAEAPPIGYRAAAAP